MILVDPIYGPAGCGKSTQLRRIAVAARGAGLKVLEISVYCGDTKASVEKVIERAAPDVVLLDDWSMRTCKWHPKDLAGPATAKLYYAIAA